MRGERVIVLARKKAGVDAGNNPTWAPTRIPVANVLVGPPSGSNAGGARPDGQTVSATLCFPRTYSGPALRNLDIEVRGAKFHVVGDPVPVDGGMKPTAWNMTVDVTRSEG